MDVHDVANVANVLDELSDYICHCAMALNDISIVIQIVVLRV